MRVTADLLLRAYEIGIFPMAESRDDTELHWIDPEHRGVLPLDALHIPRRLRRRIRRHEFEVRCDTAFHEVLLACAERTSDRPDTWINPVIELLYRELFEMGSAHSVECWQQDKLVGGLYGVSLGGAFFGESMFSRVRDASKVALVHLVQRLQDGGFELLDTQFNTPHLSQFGVTEVTRHAYHKLLARAAKRQARFPTAEVSDRPLEAFLTRTS